MKKIIDNIYKYIINNSLRLIMFVGLIALYAGQFLIINYILDNKLVCEEKTIEKDNIELDNYIVEDKKEEYIYVDVKGAVKNPNVYKIIAGSRVMDVINVAGGLLKNANTTFINLSKELKDGDAIVVYTNEEIEKANKKDIIYVETPCVCEEIKNDACYKENENNNGKININTASVEDLMKLSGIGESKAKLIIEYRNNNGLFTNIDDIKKVNGISETLFNKIKENITI